MKTNLKLCAFHFMNMHYFVTVCHIKHTKKKQSEGCDFN